MHKYWLRAARSRFLFPKHPGGRAPYPHCSDGETKAQKDPGAPPRGAQRLPPPPVPALTPEPPEVGKGNLEAGRGLPSPVQSWLPQTQCRWVRFDEKEEGFPGGSPPGGLREKGQFPEVPRSTPPRAPVAFEIKTNPAAPGIGAIHLAALRWAV